MINVEVAAMTPKDIEGVLIVENLSFTIPWSRQAFDDELTKNEFSRYVIAKVNGNIVGYGGMWKVCDEGHITNIAVHPEFRGTGVGSKILEKLIRIAKEECILRMTLEVRRTNIAAQGLYAKYGFQNSGFRKSYYSDNGEDALIMWRDKI
ncbi:MAG: ribosomal protein S18-alanine N-acetyltransferase [Clostridia bacterium]|nr:ribosomal protein S18-alanine N-acetyltransferase [Clostridia bacterium]